MKPTVRRLEKEYEGKVEFRSLDIDQTGDNVKEQYKFIGQPQFVTVAADGKISSSRNGGQSYETLKADLEKALAKN